MFDKERACVEAWGQGGKEAEKKCREDWIANERKRITDSVNGKQVRASIFSSWVG